MGVFKKLTGADVRVTPIQVKNSQTSLGNIFTAKNLIFTEFAGAYSSRIDFGPSSGEGINNEASLYNSIRQLFYGAFISQDFLINGSIFSNFTSGETPTAIPEGTFSRFDPSFQGSLSYQRNLPVEYEDTVSVISISTRDMGESIVPGTVVGTGFTDDTTGNIIDGSGDIIGNIFYDQGIIVRTDGNAASRINFTGSYTVYSTQYKCTAGPNEFNYSLNPTLLSGSSTQYDLDVVDSPEFMPYVTTVGLYNENQELMMVGKLAQAVKLNPYTDTNFIVRIDK
jgi:hypothetical protein